MNQICRSGFLLVLMTASGWAYFASHTVYSINAARSRIELAVFREGLLKSVGHNHVIMAKNFSGEIRFSPADLSDSSIRLSIDAGSLSVDDPELSEKDRKEVQTTMQGPKVLDVQKFPRIEFHSTHVINAGSNGEDLTLTGRLSLHGVEKEITFPVHVHRESDFLRATGTTTLTQSDFAMKPIRSALGTLRVKDQVQVSLDIVAEKIAP